MKRVTAFFFISLLLLSLISCSRGKETDEHTLPSDNAREDTLPSEEKNEPGAKQKKDFNIEEAPRYDLPDDQLERYISFVTPFNVFPEPFSDVKELSDHTLIFTVAAAMQVEFIPAEDEMSSFIPLSRVESKIREYFGSEAALSENYSSKDYSPYAIDKGEGILIRYSAGGMGSFLCPLAAIEVDDGYELYLADLMDPLFFDDVENQERLFAGEKIGYNDIADIALQMQINVYNVREQDNGRLVLRGFRYINQKDINHFLF